MTDTTHQEQQATAQQAKEKEQNARELQKKGAEAKQKSIEEQGAPVKPTPTQEENDLAALGVVVDPKEEDGSAPEAELRMVRTKQSEAGKPSGGTYATRSAEAKKEPTHPAATHPSGSKPT